MNKDEPLHIENNDWMKINTHIPWGESVLTQLIFLFQFGVKNYPQKADNLSQEFICTGFLSGDKTRANIKLRSIFKQTKEFINLKGRLWAIHEALETKG